MSDHHDRNWKLRPLLLAALIASLFAIPASQRPDPAVVTKAGEWRTLALDDGSELTLGPRTVLTHSFTHDQRSIRLVTGEAFFKVKKDARRPFLVKTPIGCAKALGTIFSVSHQLRSTSVTTQEGLVATARLDRTDASCSRNSIRLFTGQQAVVESWTPLVARSVDVAVEHAWTTREIVFTGETVEQALAEFNRRNWVQLDMPEDAEILKIYMFGRFPLDDPERFARYLDKQVRWRRASR
jgi:transmembrane sensor